MGGKLRRRAAAGYARRQAATGCGIGGGASSLSCSRKSAACNPADTNTPAMNTNTRTACLPIPAGYVNHLAFVN